MAFQIRDLLFSIEPVTPRGARLRLAGCAGESVPFDVVQVLDCPGRTVPDAGSVRLHGLEDLKSALAALEEQINGQLANPPK